MTFCKFISLNIKFLETHKPILLTIQCVGYLLPMHLGGHLKTGSRGLFALYY
jgi:hypothetical protein